MISTVRIYSKSIFQDSDQKPEVLSVLHVTLTAFTCRQCYIFSTVVVVVLFHRNLAIQDEFWSE